MFYSSEVLLVWKMCLLQSLDSSGVQEMVEAIDTSDSKKKAIIKLETLFPWFLKKKVTFWA